MQLTKVVDGTIHWYTIPDYSIWIDNKVIARMNTFSEAYDFAKEIDITCSILNEKTQALKTIIGEYK